MGPKTEKGIRLYLAVTAIFLLSTVALAMALVFTLSKLNILQHRKLRKELLKANYSLSIETI